MTAALLGWMADRAVIDALGTAILHSLWQVTLVAGATGLTLAMMKRATASARYVVACAGLMLSLALPTATVLARATPYGSVPLVAARLAPTPLPAISYGAATAAAALRSADARTMLDSAFPWLVAAWAVGVMLLSLRLFGGWLAVARLARRAVREPRPEWRESFERLRGRMRMSRGVRLLESAAVSVPTAIGWIRPVVLLPAAALAGLTPQQVDAIIAHELAHVRRYDYLVNLFQVGIETLLFYHPATWWLSRRVRAEREHCCDDRAVEIVGDALGYARALTRLEEQREHVAVLALAATGGTLMKRIKRLRLAGAPRTTWPLPLAVLLALVSITAVGAVATAAYAPARTSAVPSSVAQPTLPMDGRQVAPRGSIDPGNQARELWVRIRRHVTGLLAGQAPPQATAPKPAPSPKPTPAPSAAPAAPDAVDFAAIEAQVERALRDAERLAERAIRDYRNTMTPETEAEVRRALEEARRHMLQAERDVARQQIDHGRLMREYQQQMREHQQQLRENARQQARQAVESHRAEIDQAIRDYQRQMRDYARLLRDYGRSAAAGQETPPPTPPVPPAAPPVPQLAPPAPPAPPAGASSPAPRARRNRATPAPPAPAVPPASVEPSLAPPAPPAPPAVAPPAPPPPAAPSAITPPPPPAPPAPPSRSLLSQSGERGETHIRQSDDGRVLEVRSKGKIETTDDNSDITSLSPGGHITISERRGDKTVTFEARSVNGSVERKWSGLTGDAERRAWLAAHLAALRQP